MKAARLALRITWIVVIGIAAMAAHAAHAMPDTAEAWLARSQSARFPDVTMRADFEMQIERESGSHLLRRGFSLRRPTGGGLSDRLYVLTEPNSIAGIALLSKDAATEPAAQWLYVPAYRRARRVALHGAGDHFVGSDFNYADLARVRIEAGTHRLLGHKRVQERSCVVVETLNLDVGLPYSRVVQSIDEQTALPIEAEYYDRDGRLEKTGRVENVTMIAGHPTATEISMTNHLHRSKSLLRLDAIVYDLEMAPQLFTVEVLDERGPPK